MLSEAELISLVIEGENQRVDFKRDLDLDSAKGKSEFVKDVISIANSVPKEGYILLGINDDKSVVGISVVEEERIQQIVYTYITPPPALHCKTVSVHFPQPASIGVIRVRATQKPHKIARAICNLEQNEVFVRRGSVVMKASPEEIIAMSRRSWASLITKRRLHAQAARQKPRRTFMSIASILLFWLTGVLVTTWAVISNNGNHDPIVVGICGVIWGVGTGAVEAIVIRMVNWLIECREAKRTVLTLIFWTPVILGIAWGVSTGNDTADAILGVLIASFLGLVVGAVFVTVVWIIDWMLAEIGIKK